MKRPGNLLLAILLSACATVTKPPLDVIHDFARYGQTVAADPSKELVALPTVAPAIQTDVRYATTNNFMHEQLYPVAVILLRHPVAEALRQVERELEPEHIGLKVFDGYRPYRVTERMWNKIHNPDFVADPALGSRHNRGAAVDLTLIDLDTGREVSMPTPFDDFTVRARADFNNLPPDVIANRARLRDVMIAHGFDALPSEWWHFDYHGWKRFELLDIDFQTLIDPTKTQHRPSP